MEILLSFAAGIYCFLWNRQPRSNILLAKKMFLRSSPLNLKACRTGGKPYCDPRRRFLRWELQGFTRTNRQLHSHEKPQMPHRLREATNFCKATWKYYDCICKAAHFRKARPAQQGSIVRHVQRSGDPRGETCFYQRADKWYELWSLCLSVSLQCA